MMLLLVHAAATWFMTGVIWFVQVVHYPLFGLAGGAGFAEYSRRHSALTTWVVAPVMLVELGAAGLLMFYGGNLPEWMSAGGIALLAVIWLSTFLLQVPRHERLARGFDAAAHAGLVSTNWIRTLAWTARAGLSLAMISGGYR